MMNQDTHTQRLHFTNLKNFLYGHRCEGSVKPTHTRIGDKNGIRGGKYFISDEDEDEFFEHYHKEIILGNGSEYLTEKQLGVNGAIVVDFDFRYDPQIKVRQHNENDILDIIMIFLEVLKSVFKIPMDVEFFIYVFEKPNINITNEDVTKDGIHLVIGIQASSQVQMVIRDRVLEHIEENPHNIDFINDLPLKDGCTWDTVFDSGISKGVVNWQLYGSKKPSNEAYKLSGVFRVTIDDSDNEFVTEQFDHISFEKDIANFKKLSIRNKNNLSLEVQPKVMDIVNSRGNRERKKESRVLKSTPTANLKLISRMPTTSSALQVVDESDLVPLNSVSSKEQLLKWKDYLEYSFQENAKDHKLSEVHQYSLILPQKFYGDGSYNEWIRLGFALKNTNDLLFVTWILVSSKADNFDYTSIPDLYEKWCKIERKTDGHMLTSKSIIYWAKESNPSEYAEIKKKTLSYYVGVAVENDNDREIAQVLYQLASERFVCASLNSHTQIWYEFEGNRWVLDKGLRIRKSGISEDLYEVFYLEHVDLQNVIQNLTNAANLEDNEYVNMIRKNKAVTGIMTKCHNNTQKNHIAKEAAELFWDRDFSEKLDQDKYTLGFANGVVNLQTGEFREGRPLDYISKCTGIDYYPDVIMSKPENQTYQAEIVDFMTKLFPDEELREYVWEHLSSSLIGANFSQTFNIYKGSGSNGKSLLTELMSHCLGEYCNPTAPVGIITSKRQSVGGTSSELYALKSVRYAVFQEPTKGMVLNEGALKEMTGDAKIQARELYCTSTSFNQMFTLAVCTNVLFEIKSQDEGTWRRLRIIEFKSNFKNEDEYNSMSAKAKASKYIYKKDPTLKEKLPMWAPVFMRMLVNRAVKNQGIVKDCDMVLAETNKYRLKQDVIGQFADEKLTLCEEGRISKLELSQTWKIWCEVNQLQNVPKLMELTDYMSSKYTKNGKTGWMGVKIVYESEGGDNL